MRYKVTCVQCGEWDFVRINDHQHRIEVFEKVMQTPLTAGRWRPDAKWGWECGRCGNYDLLAEEEKANSRQLISGAKSRIDEIVTMLQRQPKTRFKMEAD